MALLYIFIFFFFFASVTTQSLLSNCFSQGTYDFVTTEQKNTTDYYNALYSKIQNLRYTENTVNKPSAIVFPENNQEVAHALYCTTKYNNVVRIRSGGHSYEGFSSVADFPFVIIDLNKMNSVTVNELSRTAIIQTGATLGEIYYTIATETQNRYGFTAGSCPTVGSGGHISGGGFGLLSRKHGLAADHVIDAEFMDYKGHFFTRQNMSEDLFWSLRGGGGGQFGIVLSWTVEIIPVPQIVTVFDLERESKQTIIPLLQKWQSFAPYSTDDLYMSVNIAGTGHESIYQYHYKNRSYPDAKAAFGGMYLGRSSELLAYISTEFPELNMTLSSTLEMSWIESIVYFSGLPQNSTLEALLAKNNPIRGYFKAKSDYVQSPISKSGLNMMIQHLEKNSDGYVLFDPYGGYMWNLLSDSSPFPHRAGNLFSIQYQVASNSSAKDFENISWLQKFYAAMQRHVSDNPRSAYVNYLDLDLGSANNGTVNATKSVEWNVRYFNENYDRLYSTKKSVDPYNIFRTPQTLGV